MNTSAATVTVPELAARIERYREQVAAMTATELVAAHARVGAQVATLPMDHSLWQLSADMHDLLAAELLRRLG